MKQGNKKLGRIMPSEAFELFRWSCFDRSFHASHSGLDVKALQSLPGEERNQAEALILAALPTTNDRRPIEAAGYFRLAQAASILKDRLSAGFKFPDLLVVTAVALWKIEQYSKAATLIIDVLKNSPVTDQWTRMMAVEALEDFPKSKLAIQTLINTCQDHDHFIAHNSLMSLRHIFLEDDSIRVLIDTIVLDKHSLVRKQYLKEVENLQKKIFDTGQFT